MKPPWLWPIERDENRETTKRAHVEMPPGRGRDIRHSIDNPLMRINLVTPFAEKDAVKKLGARWDAAKKLWYIVDVTDLTPFARWIPDMQAGVQDAMVNADSSLGSASKVRVDQFRGLTTGPSIDITHCGCNVQPWEDCVHTAASAAT